MSSAEANSPAEPEAHRQRQSTRPPEDIITPPVEEVALVPVEEVPVAQSSAQAVLTSRAGWILSLSITLFAGILRFWGLGSPRKVIFDEVYYSKDAHNLLKHGVELADNGTGAFVVHPPLGKWAIALGEQVFGYNSLGWRASAAVAGTLAILLVVRIALRLTGSLWAAGAAGIVLSCDGLELVQSRVSMLDIFLMFWLVVCLFAVLRHRDSPHGPWIWVLGGAMGAAVATKWDALYFIPVLAVAVLGWDFNAKVNHFRSILRLVGAGVGAFALYLVSWTGWFATSEGYDRHKEGTGILASLHSLWDYHKEAYYFHTHLSTPHPYASKPGTWLELKRPVAYFYESVPVGPHCAAAEGCSREILGVGTPLMWWGAALALIWLVGMLIRKWDGSAALVVGFFLSGWLPWFAAPHRTMFLFYMLTDLPVMALAIGLVVRQAVMSRRAGGLGKAASSIYVTAVVANFVWIWPILVGMTIAYHSWLARMMFHSWI